MPFILNLSGDIFTGYYQSSPPGKYFSLPIFLSLLWALLKAGMVLDVFSVLRVSLAHNIAVSVSRLWSVIGPFRTGFVKPLVST